MKAIFLADIDQDIDDILAVDYLNKEGKLLGIVLDPLPKSDIGKKRIEDIKKMGIKIYDEIPKCDIIFNGGAFTKLAKYLLRNKTSIIVANGGFVGENVIEKNQVLDKFKGKKYVRTFNFNLDVNSTIQVLNSNNYDQLYLIGKNVCHSERNTIKDIWKDYDFLKKYHLKPYKRLHDLLMVREGLSLIDKSYLSILEYQNVTCVNNGLKDSYTEWGSTKGGKVISAIGFKNKM